MLFRVALCGLFFWTLSLFLLVLSKLLRQHSEFVLVSSPTVQLDIKGAFHFPRNSANSGWDVNGTHVFQAFQWKVPGKKNFEKVVLFSRWELSGGNACSIYEFSQGITSSRLFRAKSLPLSWIFCDEHKRMELGSNGKRSSLDRPFHGSFGTFLINGKRPKSTQWTPRTCKSSSKQVKDRSPEKSSY